MILRLNYENFHRFGTAFVAQFRLRHECFIDRQSYNVSAWRGMEYDQYDTPAATYVVYQDDNGPVLGCARLTPVAQGSMLRDLWPDLVEDPGRVFSGPVWEGTRFCVRKDLEPALRRRVLNELVAGYVEAGLEEGIERIIGVMPPYIFRRVFIATGCRHRFLGKPMKIASGETIVAAEIEVSEDALAQVRMAIGVTWPVIHSGLPPVFMKAA